MGVDVVEDVSQRRLKKSKKPKDRDSRRRETLIDGDDTQGKQDKREKEKRREEVTSSPAGQDGRLQKKKKRRRDADEESIAELDRSTEGKKKKHKKPLDSSDNVETYSSSSSAGAMKPSPGPAPSPAEMKAYLATHSVTFHTEHPEEIVPFISFGQLDIPFELRSALTGFKEPTPIQACTWPPGMQGRDVIGVAETGSGKTLAFGIPALSRLASSSCPHRKKEKPKVTVLVISPTRELAIQTHDTLSELGAPFGIASVAVFGGVAKESQIKSLANHAKNGKTTRIVVGTPGRILDLAQEGVCDLSQVDYLVLDEADRMLDKGFENDIRNIISQTKQGAERQTMMFSATWPEGVRRLASTFLQNPIRVTVGSEDLAANSRVEQIVHVFDDPRSKDSRLLAQLRALEHQKGAKCAPDGSRILVFALYKKEASRIEAMLRRQGYKVGALHGDMSQPARMEALENFKNGTTILLVATDVAARGLDIPNVGVVINYTFPLTVEDYVHRIGRTGRGGRNGQSITYFTGENHERSLAGEFARLLRESGVEAEGLKKFPMTIKKKEHSAYGAFFRDDIPAPAGPTKIVF